MQGVEREQIWQGWGLVAALNLLASEGRRGKVSKEGRAEWTAVVPADVERKRIILPSGLCAGGMG